MYIPWGTEHHGSWFLYGYRAQRFLIPGHRAPLVPGSGTTYLGTILPGSSRAGTPYPGYQTFLFVPRQYGFQSKLTNLSNTKALHITNNTIHHNPQYQYCNKNTQVVK